MILEKALNLLNPKYILRTDLTPQTLLDKLDVIECFEYPNTKLRVGEVLEKQKEIYEALGVDVSR